MTYAGTETSDCARKDHLPMQDVCASNIKHTMLARQHKSGAPASLTTTHISQQAACVRQTSADSDFSQSSNSSWGQSNNLLHEAPGVTSLQLHELVGRGAFGSVYSGTWKGQPAAIKASFCLLLTAKFGLLPKASVCLHNSMKVAGLCTCCCHLPCCKA